MLTTLAFRVRDSYEGGGRSACRVLHAPLWMRCAGMLLRKGLPPSNVLSARRHRAARDRAQGGAGAVEENPVRQNRHDERRATEEERRPACAPSSAPPSRQTLPSSTHSSYH